jgi:hypothetical protein
MHADAANSNYNKTVWSSLVFLFHELTQFSLFDRRRKVQLFNFLLPSRSAQKYLHTQTINFKFKNLYQRLSRSIFEFKSSY